MLSETQRKYGAPLAGSFSFQDADSARAVNVDRKSTRELRQRAIVALEMSRGRDRDLEINRLYRTLAERQAFADMRHVGTREQTLARWAYSGTRISAPKPPKVQDSGKRVFIVSA
jgi:hypothetical protein